jgi:hypothetical protein
MAHARLSPSASERWLSCPASARMEAALPPQPSSPYAQEGTDAHTLAELEGRYAFGLISVTEYARRRDEWVQATPEDQQPDMIRYVEKYVEFLRERMTPNSTIQFEKRVDTGVPGCWGTADAIISTPTHIDVVDFKYGQGIAVEAPGNTQLRFYGVGGLELYNLLGTIDTVSVWIYQPRLDLVSHETLTVGDLLAWREEVTPVAAAALDGTGWFGPSETACRWCPVAGECKPRLEHMTAMDFGNPDLLSPEEIAEALERMPEVKDWVKALEAVALTKAYTEGVRIPGFKVVKSGGRRGFPDPTKAIARLIETGYTAEQVSELRIKTLGALENLVGKEELPKLMGSLLVKSEGRESLVPESDSRPAISSHSEAMKDFDN